MQGLENQSIDMNPHVPSGLKAITDVGSMRHTSSSLLTDAVNYWLSGTLVFAHATACVEIVLLHSDKANEIYREIVKAWGLSGNQGLLETTSLHMPNSADLFIDSIRANKANMQVNLSTKTKRQSQAKSQSKLEPGGYSDNPYPDLTLWFQSDKFRRMSEHPDYQYLVKLINELILVGFNRKIDQDNQAWKVTPDAPPYWLSNAITWKSMLEYENIRPQDLVQFKVAVRQGTPRQQARWQAVQAAKQRGLSSRQIAKVLGIGRNTVRRYIAVDSPPVYPERRSGEKGLEREAVDDKHHDFDYEMPRRPSTRKERSIRSVLIKAFKHDGFALRHDAKLLQDADHWYKCRVNPGTIEAYLNELAKDGICLERGYIESAIAPCDQATGYPRKWRK